MYISKKQWVQLPSELASKPPLKIQADVHITAIGGGFREGLCSWNGYVLTVFKKHPPPEGRGKKILWQVTDYIRS